MFLFCTTTSNTNWYLKCLSFSVPLHRCFSRTLFSLASRIIKSILFGIWAQLEHVKFRKDRLDNNTLAQSLDLNALLTITHSQSKVTNSIKWGSMLAVTFIAGVWIFQLTIHWVGSSTIYTNGPLYPQHMNSMRVTLSNNIKSHGWSMTPTSKNQRWRSLCPNIRLYTRSDLFF